MVAVVASDYQTVHKNGGRPRKSSVEDAVLTTLEYYEEYRTLECIGASYGLKKTNVAKTIAWVEKTLIKCGLFNLPGKRTLFQSNIEYDVIVVDGAEIPIERPKKEQRKHYSGKKTTYGKGSGRNRPKKRKIICVDFFNGRAHDGAIFKTTSRISGNIPVLADGGYGGVQKRMQTQSFRYVIKRTKRRCRTTNAMLITSLFQARE
jgi:hypothetical protein